MPSFIKDTMKGKDEQKFEEMKKEIHDAVHGEDAEEPEGAEAYDEAEVRETPETEAPEEDTVQTEAEQLKEALAAEKDRALRLQADFENFRRRTTKEKEELSAVITQGFLKDMLPLVDNFERAMAAEGKDVETFQKGVEMISTQLQEVLKKHGLEVIETEGQKFDPNFHQAVMRVQNPELEDDTIAQVLQKGYMAKGRVIRPSMVQVVSNG